MRKQSVILRTAAHVLLPLLLLFSAFLLLRGHNAPGGGFIAGLVASAALALYLFSLGIASARRALGVDPRRLIGAGLVIAIASALPAAFFGEAFFSAQWLTLDWFPSGPLKLGTPLLFDLGVYLVVIGSVMTIVLTLAEAEERPDAPASEGD